MARIIVTLKQHERDALFAVAERELRDPRAQAALMIRVELERLGLLSKKNQHSKKATSTDIKEERSPSG